MQPKALKCFTILACSVLSFMNFGEGYDAIFHELQSMRRGVFVYAETWIEAELPLGVTLQQRLPLPAGAD